uniref:Putative secreted protein n=1 Tax=Anopheles darlingi TaxID=43151 RepID=A0A2M4D9V7_ANODA
MFLLVLLFFCRSFLYLFYKLSHESVSCFCTDLARMPIHSLPLQQTTYEPCVKHASDHHETILHPLSDEIEHQR